MKPLLSRLLLSINKLYLILPILLAVAAIFRLHGIDWDSGFGFHPDERSIYMRAQCMYDVLRQQPGYQSCLLAHPQMEPGFPYISTIFDPARSPLNPNWFPLGSVIIYLLVIVQYLISPIMDLTGLEIRYFARALSTLADLGTIFFVFLIGRRIYHVQVGLLAAALVTLSVIHIQNSHFYRPETFSVCLILMSFWAMLRVMEYGRIRDSVFLGISVGLALAPKISAITMLIVLGVPYFIQAFNGTYASPQGVRIRFCYWPFMYALLALCLAVSVFILVTPYALIDAGNFIKDIKAQSYMANNPGVWPFTYQYMDTSNFIYQIYQSTVWGLGIPLGVVCWGSVLFTCGSALVSRKHRIFDLMLLGCVIPTFIFLETFGVKFLRYVFPLTPFMILMAARLLWWMREVTNGDIGFRAPTFITRLRGQQLEIKNKWLGKVAVVLTALLIISTGFYAVAFLRIYSSEHPAVSASKWINKNIEPGSMMISDNHWDEYIPGLQRYRTWQFPVYEPDNPNKINNLVTRLSEADYVVFYSNRTYGSVARLPSEFPLSSRYYIKLFEGELGYRLEKGFYSYPNWLNVHFRDDPFGRAQVKRPESWSQRDGLVLTLGYADDNVIGYDHPPVLVFKNHQKKSESELRKILLLDVPDGEPVISKVRDSDGDSGTLPLMLTESDWLIQRQGGTWSQMFNDNSWNNRFPVLAWLLVIMVGWLITLPLNLFIFKGLPDRGLGLARIFSFLIIGYVVWISVSLHLFRFTNMAIFYSSCVVLVLSLLVLAFTRNEIIIFLKEKWRLVILVDVIFFLSFFIFLWIRASNPDLWHPFRGGEKPMELAYLNAVVRSSLFPPYDPWFSGGYLNYYYWGYFLVSLPVKIAGVIPATAFNLAIPTFFALSVSGAFSLGYNIACKIGMVDSRLRTGIGSFEPYPNDLRNNPKLSNLRSYPNLLRSCVWPPLMLVQSRVPIPVLVGIASAIGVVVVGNLDGIIQLLQMNQSDINGDQTFDFWRSSRLIPALSNVEGSLIAFWLPTTVDGATEISHHITEFPFFSFLFADLHPHLMNMPFAMLVIGLGINLQFQFKTSKVLWKIIACGILALGLGSLWVINSWDYPTYLLLSIAFLGLSVQSMEIAKLKKLLLFSFLVFSIVGASWILFFEFHESYETFGAGIDISRWRTPLSSYLVIFGWFLFIAVSFLCLKISRIVLEIVVKVRNKDLLLPYELTGLIIALVCLAFVVYLVLAEYWTAACLVMLLGMSVLAMLIELTRKPSKHTIHIIPLLLLSMALTISIGVEFVHISGDIGRMNTLFKLYLEVWVLFGVATSYMGFIVLQRLHVVWTRGKRYRYLSGLWLSIAVVLMISTLIYPVLGTLDRINDRFQRTDMTLDGVAYMEKAQHWEDNAQLDLKWDLEAIQWLQTNIYGSPVILEAHHSQYRWNGRVSAHTGLPTILGWPWHQTQQRNDYQDLILERAKDVELIYDLEDINLTRALLTKYEVSLIYVGELENSYYSSVGLDKFDRMVSDGLIERVFQNQGATIYRILLR